MTFAQHKMQGRKSNPLWTVPYRTSVRVAIEGGRVGFDRACFPLGRVVFFGGAYFGGDQKKLMR